MSIILERDYTPGIWGPITFYYDHNLTTIVASSTASGYPASNLLSRLDLLYWKPTSMADQWIKHNALASYAVDYLAIGDHSLGSCGATVVLQYSNDDFVADIHDAFTAVALSSDKPLVVEFNEISSQNWRLKITLLTDVPRIGKLWWGRKTQLDFASVGFDPLAEDDQAIVVAGGAGHLLGVHDTWRKMEMAIRFSPGAPELYGKLAAWREAVGRGSFFMAWEPVEHPDDVYLVRGDARFNNPLMRGAGWRDITVNLTGRKE